MFRFKTIGLIFSVLTSIAIGLPASTLVIEMEREELIQRSSVIFKGRVVDTQSRWNERGNLIVTDVTFDVQDVLYGKAASPMVLTFAGGEIDGERHSVSDVPSFTPGEVVLLMVEDSNQPSFSPVTGVDQGKFLSTMSTAKDRAVVGDADGAMLRDALGYLLDFDDFVEQVRREIPLAKSLPVPDRFNVPADFEMFRMTELPSKRYEASKGATAPAGTGKYHLPLRPPTSGDSPAPGDASSGTETKSQIEAPETQAAQMGARWSYSGRAKTVPIVFNPLGGSFMNDQYQMAYWNEYANIFRVLTTPTGTWASNNDRYDIAGWVGSEVLTAQYNYTWAAFHLAVAFTRTVNGFGVECDIAVNPAFNWTTDDYATYNNTNLHNANRTLLHEIGHCWGLDHQFNALSVMNYSPHKYRAYAELYADDVVAVRFAFPADAVSLTDVGISLFYANGDKNYDDSELSTTNLWQGDRLTVSNFVIENSGTTTASPVVDWYLVPDINSWRGNIYVGRTTHSSLNPSYYSKQSRTLTIPQTVPPGTYFLGAFNRTTGDSVSKNNATWLDRQIAVQQDCSRDGYESDDAYWTGSSLSPGATQSHTICLEGDQDWVRFTLTRDSAITLRTNGSAGDTRLTLYNSSLSQVDFDDDGGTGRFSLINRTCAVDALPAGIYYAKVDEYGNDDLIQGYTLSLSASACAIDSDGDGTPDAEDNCRNVPNRGQWDNDRDGYGNACDGDFNQDGAADGVDFINVFLRDLTLGVDLENGTDMNEDGVVDGRDFNHFISQFEQGIPGPSGLTCAGRIPCTR